MNMDSKPGDVWDEVLGWCTPSEKANRCSSIPSAELLGVSWHLEQHRKGFVTTWKMGTKEEVLAELEACRKEIKDFMEDQYKIVRVERYLETPNDSGLLRQVQKGASK